MQETAEVVDEPVLHRQHQRVFMFIRVKRKRAERPLRHVRAVRRDVPGLLDKLFAFHVAHLQQRDEQRLFFGGQGNVAGDVAQERRKVGHGGALPAAAVRGYP